jgi:hypothetical protein
MDDFAQKMNAEIQALIGAQALDVVALKVNLQIANARVAELERELAELKGKPTEAE